MLRTKRPHYTEIEAGWLQGACEVVLKTDNSLEVNSSLRLLFFKDIWKNKIGKTFETFIIFDCLDVIVLSAIKDQLNKKEVC